MQEVAQNVYRTYGWLQKLPWYAAACEDGEEELLRGQGAKSNLECRERYGVPIFHLFPRTLGNHAIVLVMQTCGGQNSIPTIGTGC